MKNGLIIMMLLFTGQMFAQGALGEVMGELVERKTGAPAVDAIAFIEDNGKKYQTRVDLDGRFRISAIPAGTYFLQFRYRNDTMAKKFEVNVPMDGFFRLAKVEFIPTILEKDPVIVMYDRNRPRLIDGFLPVKTITSEDIAVSSSKNDIKGLITGGSTDVRMTNDGELVFRGARKGDMLYLMDGVKTDNIGVVPSSAIGRMMIYSGGLPAKYGDTMGGVVVMESKSYFDLYRQWEAQEIKAGRR